MILFSEISIEQLKIQGKSFNWKKPDACPRCTRKIWGHGFVLLNKMFLKRYRCDSCCAVITLKPHGFWKKYRSSSRDIYQAIRVRLTTLKWPVGVSRQVGQHWLVKFVTWIRVVYGCDSSERGLLEILDYLHGRQINFLS